MAGAARRQEGVGSGRPWRWSSPGLARPSLDAPCATLPSGTRRFSAPTRRQEPEGLRVVAGGGDGEAESDGRPSSMVTQLLPPSSLRYMPQVVLLVEPIGPAGCHGEAVHALAEYGVGGAGADEVAACALVARAPAVTASVAVEDAGDRDADRELLWSLRVGEDVVEDEPAPPGTPSLREGDW